MDIYLRSSHCGETRSRQAEIDRPSFTIGSFPRATPARLSGDTTPCKVTPVILPGVVSPCIPRGLVAAMGHSLNVKCLLTAFPTPSESSLKNSVVSNQNTPGLSQGGGHFQHAPRSNHYTQTLELHDLESKGVWHSLLRAGWNQRSKLHCLLFFFITLKPRVG